MISKMNDERFLNELEQMVEKPLPENLTQVQRSLLNAVKQGVIPHTEVENILKIHDIKVSDLMREYESWRQ